MSFHVPEKLRVRRSELASDPTDDNNGLFIIPAGLRRPYALRCIASDGSDWETIGLPPPHGNT